MVIKVCDAAAGQQCPIFSSAMTTFIWSFPDPAGFTGTDEEIMGQVRQLRDQIKARIEEMVRVIVIG